MINAQAHTSQQPLRTPRAAAITRLLFAVFRITTFVLLQVSIPADPFDHQDWLGEQS